MPSFRVRFWEIERKRDAKPEQLHPFKVEASTSDEALRATRMELGRRRRKIRALSILDDETLSAVVFKGELAPKLEIAPSEGTSGRHNRQRIRERSRVEQERRQADREAAAREARIEAKQVETKIGNAAAAAERTRRCAAEVKRSEAAQKERKFAQAKRFEVRQQERAERLQKRREEDAERCAEELRKRERSRKKKAQPQEEPHAPTS